MLPPIEDHFVQTNGVELHVVMAGDPEGPKVLLLHGFPEFWYGWRHQIGPLVKAGYRVVVPDQRGYNLSDKPGSMADYSVGQLSRDAVGLIDHLGVERVKLVGHDWGGYVAWWVALQFPERVEQLAVLNIPHPIAFSRALRRWPQLRKSWYILFFQLPWLPEALLAKGGYAALLNLMKKSCRRGAIAPADLEHYQRAYAQPGALKAMLSWYRAAFRLRAERLRTRVVEPPTLVVWGQRDEALGWEMAQPSVELCRDGRLELIADAGHFVALDSAREVNASLLDFFAER